MPKPGSYIVLEGFHRCGKTTQADLLADHINSLYPGLAVRGEEPAPDGEGVARPFLKGDSVRDYITEALVMYGDRRMYLQNVVAPQVAAGKVVVITRNFFSSFVLQGLPNGEEGLKTVQAIHEIVMPGLIQPDLFLYLDVPDERLEERSTLEFLADDSVERRSQNLMANPIYFRTIDHLNSNLDSTITELVVVNGHKAIDEVQANIWAHVEPLLPKEAS